MCILRNRRRRKPSYKLVAKSLLAQLFHPLGDGVPSGNWQGRAKHALRTFEKRILRLLILGYCKKTSPVG